MGPKLVSSKTLGTQLNYPSTLGLTLNYPSTLGLTLNYTSTLGLTLNYPSTLGLTLGHKSRIKQNIWNSKIVCEMLPLNQNYCPIKLRINETMQGARKYQTLQQSSVLPPPIPCGDIVEQTVVALEGHKSQDGE